MKGSRLTIAVMFGMVFMVGFVTMFTGPLAAVMKAQFGASNALSQFGSSANFLAYLFMGLPCGMVLKRKGYNAEAMHSDLLQEQRDDVMYRFKTGQIDILVATDIVARGIDIDDIQLVINYDVPHDEEDYVHRIGRTARAGRDGRAITLVSEKDQPLFAAIERFLEKEVPKEAIPEELGEAPAYTGRGSASRTGSKGRGHGRGRGGHGRGRGNHGKGEGHGKDRKDGKGSAPKAENSGNNAEAKPAGEGKKKKHRGGHHRRKEAE